MSRQQVKEKDTWNLVSFFETKEAWEQKLKKIFEESESGFLKIKPISFSKDADPKRVKQVLSDFFEYMRQLDMIYTYAHLKHDEDISFTENKEAYEKARSLYHRFMSAASWIEPSILQMDEKAFEALLNAKELSGYHFYLKKLKDQKEHILTSDKEEMMSLSGRMQGTASGAFSALTNADMDFGIVKNGKGEELSLTQASYGKYLKEQDRVLRKNASEKLHASYVSFENTISELIHGQVQNHIFNAKVRSYKNCLEAALKPHNIPLSVYHNLIDTVSNGLAPLHRYTSFRKKRLGVDKLYAYDLYVPLIEMSEKNYTFDEACEIVIESVAILGEEYQAILRKGLTVDRWVDVYENKGKRSGAYSSGCYDSNPYILMNFQGTLNDVLTLSHEAGHSMNTYLSNRKQSYHDAGYTIFVAEVASTFNEQLTYEYLYKKAKTKEERIFLLSAQLDAIRSTFFRQTLFAEFELKIHEMAEDHAPLTPDIMKKVYGDLNRKYYGKDFTVTDGSSAEYLRIPHFYYNFYVYQYATGIAAALTLVEKVRNGALAPYLGFLEAGGSKYSIDILKEAGADMSSKEPIENTLKIFSTLLEKLEKEFEIN
ncbi:MAG: Oligoendopeptidase F, plasmid [Chlamydiia bacterium]|nr:Oligoendopeptidase F, plasmid [Chlamydiia bacterium]MCH9617980.1 Oligoendopeptidase F, plasmid [Chlamydiia bacterium]MCH9623695.1 Oligoendopeptidase F, plasmid [Chlamydiia bacterium]